MYAASRANSVAIRLVAVAVIAAAAPVQAALPQPAPQVQPAPRVPQPPSAAPTPQRQPTPPANWSVEQRGPGRDSHWLVRVWQFLVGLLQVPPGQPPFRDAFSVEDPQRPWRNAPPRR